jgi:iron complex outermembrane receptor protein
MKRIAFFVLFSSSLTIWAQEKEKDSTLLEPVEVKAVRASSTAPFAKTNISKSQIERQNLGQDLPFLLNQTPSVVVNSDAGNGVGYTGIHIRGTDPTRINVTLNGIPYNDAESQGTYFVDLPDFASSVNSIQIQRGVGTSTNGAGAFGATINFSTNEIIKKPYAELNNSYGSFDTWKNTIKAGSGLIGNHFTTDIRLSSITSDGYIDRASSNLKSLYFSTAYTSDKTDLRFNIFAGKEKTYQAWYGVSEEDLKTDRTINYAGMEKPGSPYDNETDNYWQNHYQLFFTQRFNPKLSFNTAVFLTRGYGYYEEYRAAQAYADYNVPSPATGTDTTDLIRRLWLDNYFYGDIFSLQYHAQKTQLTLGGAVTKYDGDHYGEVIWAEHGWTGPNRWYDVNATKGDQNVFVKWQQDLSKTFQLFTDLQYRRVDYHLNGFEGDPNLIIKPIYNFFNPKMGLSYHYQNWLAYASYSVANKEPNRDDFESNLPQQPKFEHLNDLEVGMENKNAKRSFSASIYYMKYKDQLVLTGKINDVGDYTRTNIPYSYRLGIELQGSSIVTKWLQASANLTLSRNKILNFTEYIDDYEHGTFYPKTNISFSPELIGSATVTVTPVKNIAIDLLSKYVSEQYLDNTNNEARKLNPYYVQDARIIYTLNKGLLKNTNLIFQVNNVFNKMYEPNGYTYSYYDNNSLVTENYYYPMAGTNWMFAVNIKL